MHVTPRILPVAYLSKTVQSEASYLRIYTFVRMCIHIFIAHWTRQWRNPNIAHFELILQLSSNFNG